jgi:hypothetical protein
VREPGFYQDIPAAEYHSDPDSISASSLKTLLKAPALYRHRQANPEQSGALDLGSAAHALVLGKDMDDIYVAPFDNWRTKAAQEEQRLARESGLSPVNTTEWATVSAMADKLAENSVAMRLLSGGEAEVSGYAVDEATGFLRRCRFDYLSDDVGVDYKSTKDASPRAFASSVATYGYDLSAAFYLDIAADLGRALAAFALIAQEKEPPYLVEVYELDAAFLDRGRRRYRLALERLRDCRESGHWPGYTGREFSTLTPPRWATYDNDLEHTA